MVPLVQVVFGFELAITIGKAFVITSTVVGIDAQPVNVLVPVTVYVVLDIGDTVVVFVVDVVLHV